MKTSILVRLLIFSLLALALSPWQAQAAAPAALYLTQYRTDQPAAAMPAVDVPPELFVDVNDPACDDANPGTAGQPLCHIQAAADRATPGVTVQVKAGVYREMVLVRRSGTAGAPIRFVAADEARVVVDSPGYACFDLQGVEYIKIHGFELIGAWGGERTPVAHGAGIRAYPADPADYGVRRSVFADNVIHDNDAGIWLVYSDDNLIQDNVLYRNGEAPIRIKRGRRNEIANNLAFDNGTRERWGVTFYCAEGTRVHHNTIVERSGGAVYIYEGTSNLGDPPAQPGDPSFCIPSNHTAVYDNIGVVAGDTAGESASLVIGSSTTTDRDPLLDALYGPLDNRYHHNLWYNKAHPEAVVSWGDLSERDTFPHYALLNLAEFGQQGEGYGAGSLAADPLFVDPAGYDFRLSAASPARETASDGRDLGVDFTSLPPFPRRPDAPAAPSTPGASPAPIVLADRGNGLELIFAPLAISLTVGHAAYLPVEVQGYRRPITVTAQTQIHTYVNDRTASEPGASATFGVGTLDEPAAELKLQTLRMYEHRLALTFEAGEGNRSAATSPMRTSVTVPLTITVAVAPHTPLFGLDAAGWLDLPFTPIYGPDCTPCGDPLTEDRACYRRVADQGRCRPWDVRFDEERAAETLHAAVQAQVYASQVTRDAPTVQGHIFTDPGRFVWTQPDWLFDVLKPQVGGHWSASWYVLPGAPWMQHCGPLCQNPDGSAGLYDPDNAYLMGQYREFVHELSQRYAGQLRHYELVNEPAAEFWLCPCLATGAACDATYGPNQPACAWRWDEAAQSWTGGPDSQNFVDAYGDLLLQTADIAAEEIARADPDALVITGAVDMGSSLLKTTEYMIAPDRGDLLRRRPNVVIGVHQYPYFNPPPWLRDEHGQPLNCSYLQPGHDWYWLPEGCETAPPFDGVFDGRPAQLLWRHQDENVDLSETLAEARDLGVLDHFYMYDTELHAGWHAGDGDGDPATPVTTTPAREAIAGLRIAAIDAHQKMIGAEFIFGPANPAIYNLMVGRLAGATPVYAWDAPMIGADYSGVVYKLFTRPVQGAADDSLGEDIIAIWSNAAEPVAVTLTLGEESGDAPLPSQGGGWGVGRRVSGQFKEVVLTTLAASLPRADLPEQLFPTSERLDRPPESIVVRPLRDFIFLSVISDRSGFGWLTDIASSSPQRVHLPLVSRDGR